MEFPVEDIRIDLIWCGPGRGSKTRIVHLPSGSTAIESIPADSTEPVIHMRDRLFKELKKMMKGNHKDF